MCYTETTRFIVYSFWREVGGLFEIDAKLFIIVITIQSNNALFFFFLFFFNWYKRQFANDSASLSERTGKWLIEAK